MQWSLIYILHPRLPCRATLQRRVNELHTKVAKEVERTLTAARVVGLAMDEWEDEAHAATFGITAMPLVRAGKPVLIEYCRVCERQTADNIQERLGKAMAYLAGLGCRAVVCVTDNAANMVVAVRQALEQHRAGHFFNCEKSPGHI